MSDVQVPLVPTVELDENITEEELAALCNSEDDEVLVAVAYHPLTSLNMLYFLAEYCYLTFEVLQNPMFPLYLESGDQQAVDILAQSASFLKDPEKLKELANSPFPEVRSKVAKSEYLPPSLLDELVRTKPDLLALQECATMNPNILVETLTFLSLSPNDRVRRRVARHQTTLPETLRLLSQDSFLTVVAEVADNPNTPMDVLLDLTYHEDQDIADAAGRNFRNSRKKNPIAELDEDLSEEELSRLAKGGSEDQQRAVAKHPNATLKTLLELATKGFADDVDEHPMLLLYFEAGEPDAIVVFAKVAEQTRRTQRLEELATFANDGIRRCVAKNLNTPMSILALLAKDKNSFVRFAVARNIETPSEILAQLANDAKDDVRIGVALNEKTPVDILTMLSNDTRIGVRHGVAANINTPVATLAMLSKDEHENVRQAVAKNTNTSRTVLDVLTKDISYVVSRTAEGTLVKIGQK